MSPTTKQMREKQAKTKKAKQGAKRRPAVGAPEATPAAEATITVDGITLPNRPPYFVGDAATNETIAQAVIDLRIEVGELKGESWSPDCGAKTWAKKIGRPGLLRQHEQMLDAVVTEMVKVREADAAEAAQVAAESAPAGEKAPRAPKAPRTPREKDPRTPAPGTVLRKTKGDLTVECLVAPEGFTFEGTTYRSLSSAAMAAAAKLGLGSKAQNGFAFWGLLPKAERKARSPKPASALEVAARALVTHLAAGHQVNANSPEVVTLAGVLGGVVPTAGTESTVQPAKLTMSPDGVLPELAAQVGAETEEETKARLNREMSEPPFGQPGGVA